MDNDGKNKFDDEGNPVNYENGTPMLDKNGEPMLDEKRKTINYSVKVFQAAKNKPDPYSYFVKIVDKYGKEREIGNNVTSEYTSRDNKYHTYFELYDDYIKQQTEKGSEAIEYSDKNFPEFIKIELHYDNKSFYILGIDKYLNDGVMMKKDIEIPVRVYKKLKPNEEGIKKNKNPLFSIFGGKRVKSRKNHNKKPKKTANKKTQKKKTRQFSKRHF